MNSATNKRAVSQIHNNRKEGTKIRIRIKRIGKDLSKALVSKVVVPDKVQGKALSKKIKAIRVAMTNQEVEKSKIHADRMTIKPANNQTRDKDRNRKEKNKK